MERKSNANGTQMERIFERIPDAFRTRFLLHRLFLSSTEHIVLFSVTILLTGCFSVVANKRIIFSDFQMGVCVMSLNDLSK